MKDFSDILAHFFGDKSNDLVDPDLFAETIWTAIKEEAKDKPSQTAAKPKPQERNPLNLFSTDARPVKTLYTPTGNELLGIQKDLTSYSVRELKMMAEPYMKLVRKYRMTSEDSTQRRRVEKLFDVILSGSGVLKKDWVNFMAIFRHPRNFEIFLEELTHRQKELIRTVAEKHYVSRREANKITGDKIAVHYAYNGHKQITGALGNWLTIDDEARGGYWREHNLICFKDKRMYREMLLKYHPNMDAIEGFEELPKGIPLLTFNNEQDILRELSIMEMLYKSGKLKIGRNKLTAPTFANARKATGIKEFFNNANPSLPTPYCAHIVLNLYAHYRLMKEKKADMPSPADIIDETIKMVPVEASTYIPIVMSHIRGWNKKELFAATPIIVLENLRRELCFYADKGWIPAEKLLFNVRTRNDDDENRFFFARFEEMAEGYLVNEFRDLAPIDGSNLTEEFFMAFLQANLFVLAAFGALEIAYKSPQPGKDTSPYVGIRYVKLTKLGRYILHLDQTYEMKQEEGKGYFELDENSLFIKSTTENNPFISMVSDLATPITSKLYKVSFASFLNGCATKKDINSRIALFKQYICPQPPKNWQQFFKDVSARCKILKTPDTQYEILTIPAEQKELQRIILTDPAIRPYVKKAEDYTILIDTKHKKKVSDRLITYGYLI